MIAVKRRTAIYARTATDDARGSRCADQIRRLQEVIEGEVDRPTVYADVAQSGNEPARPRLRRLVQDAGQGKVRRVLVQDFSRLARCPALLTSILAELEAAGVVVETAEEVRADA